MNFDLLLQFKGTRNYIHGPDILYESMSGLMRRFPSGFKNVDLAMHRMTDRNLRLSLYRSDTIIANAAPERIATLRFQAEAATWIAYLTELPTTPSTRKNYDESAVIDLCHCEDEAALISLTQPSALNPVETLIAMTKALHLRLYPLPDAQWIFARWESKCWPLPSQPAGIKVQITQTLGNYLTKSEIKLGGHSFGHIFFSAKKKAL